MEPGMSDRRQRILDRIEDPTVRKILVMRWWERSEITPAETTELIRANSLEAA
jgi:hypothetical protein